MMDEPYELVIHPRLLARLAEKAYESARDPARLSRWEMHAVRWAFQVLRQGREEFFGGERLGRSDRHVDLRDCAEIKVPVIQEYDARGRPFGPSHRMIYRQYAMPNRSRPVREVIAFAPRADGLPFKMAGADLERPIGIALDDLEGVENTRPAVGRRKDPDRATGPVQKTPSPDVAAALATRLARSPRGPVFSDPARSTLADQAVRAGQVAPPTNARWQIGHSRPQRSADLPRQRGVDS